MQSKPIEEARIYLQFPSSLELGSARDYRVRKRSGKNNASANNTRKAFGDANEKQMPVLLCIERYNQHMGAHQLRSYYDKQLTSFRTLRPMHFGSQDDHEC